MRRAFFAAVLTFASITAPVQAGGFLADVFVKPFSPDAAKALDDANREIKKAVPLYGAAEEGVTNIVKEARVQELAPLVAAAIAASKQQALADGVETIPDDIRANLEGFVPTEDLDRVRWRAGGGGDLSVQQNAFKYGDAAAITLDDVVVFKEQSDAESNVGLWAHELRHVGQYRAWGLYDFSIRYVRNRNAVEREAEEFAVSWAARNITILASTEPNVDFSSAQDRQALSRPAVALSSGNQRGQMCSTAMSQCQLSQEGDVGGPCWCGTPYGASIGSISAMSAPSQSANMCQTWAGACTFSGPTNVGGFCACSSAYGGVFPGQAQLAMSTPPPPQAAGACYTQWGACPMAVAVPVGSSCYCQSMQGPVPGMAQ